MGAFLGVFIFIVVAGFMVSTLMMMEAVELIFPLLYLAIAVGILTQC